jgi:hypothetical protein
MFQSSNKVFKTHKDADSLANLLFHPLEITGNASAAFEMRAEKPP